MNYEDMAEAILAAAARAVGGVANMADLHLDRRTAPDGREGFFIAAGYEPD